MVMDLSSGIPSICEKHGYKNMVFRVNTKNACNDLYGVFNREFDISIKMKVFGYKSGYVITRLWCNYTDYCWTCVGFAKTEDERDTLMNIGKIGQLGGNLARGAETVVTTLTGGLFAIPSHLIKTINQTVLNLSSMYNDTPYTYGYT
jgi:hypothetical protein